MDSYKVEKEIRFQNHSGKIIVFSVGEKIKRADLMTDNQLKGFLGNGCLVAESKAKDEAKAKEAAKLEAEALKEAKAKDEAKQKEADEAERLALEAKAKQDEAEKAKEPKEAKAKEPKE